MATAERTYSFRAPADFGARLAAAREAWVRLADEGPDVADWLDREYSMEIARLRRRQPAVARDQSSFMRAFVEAAVRATEEVSAGLEAERRFRAAGAPVDPESAAWAESAALGAAETWSD